MPDTAELANSAYNAYGASTGFKNFQGDPMPGYGDLPLEIRRAWEAAVAHVVQEVSPKPLVDSDRMGRDPVQQSDEYDLDGLQEPFVAGDSSQPEMSNRERRFMEMTGDTPAS